jgi:small subunit ribosomal protein S3
VWIFKGEILEHDPMASERRQTEAADQATTRRPRERDRERGDRDRERGDRDREPVSAAE